jgi:hypothetical protein
MDKPDEHESLAAHFGLTIACALRNGINVPPTAFSFIQNNPPEHDFDV